MKLTDQYQYLDKFLKSYDEEDYDFSDVTLPVDTLYSIVKELKLARN